MAKREDNLMPVEELNSRRTPEQHSADSRKGGKRSGEVRAFRKTFREEFIQALSDETKQKELIDAMIKEARKGNVKAFEVIRDTLGEKPKEEINASVENVIKVKLKNGNDS